jgi:dipeptidyl aminopeptidase/acylaminoacyl peptidase
VGREQHSAQEDSRKTEKLFAIEKKKPKEAPSLCEIPLSAAPVRKYVFKPGDRFIDFIRANPSTAWQSENYSFFAKIQKPDGKIKITGFDSVSGKSKDFWEGRGQFVFPQVQASKETVFAQYQDLQTPEGLFAFNKDFSDKTRKTASSESTLSRASLHSFQTEVRLNGEKKQMRTVVILPPGSNSKNPPPAVIVGYPGSSLGSDINRYGGGDPTGSLPNQILLQQGYAVILPELLISPTGKASDPLKDLTLLLNATVDTVAKARIVDTSRLALLGHSYGGYMAAGVPAFSKKFKAAVSISAVFDLSQHYSILNKEGDSLDC